MSAIISLQKGAPASADRSGFFGPEAAMAASNFVVNTDVDVDDAGRSETGKARRLGGSEPGSEPAEASSKTYVCDVPLFGQVTKNQHCQSSWRSIAAVPGLHLRLEFIPTTPAKPLVCNTHDKHELSEIAVDFIEVAQDP
jgi:hypothetical protein